MEYVFNCFCKYPCMCCQESCNTVKQALGECCGAISGLFGPICGRPLGGYVLVTWLVMLMAVAACAVDLLSETVKKCTQLRDFCIAEIGCALVHAGAAFYIQRKVISAAAKSTGKSVEELNKLSSSELFDAAKDIAWKDIGFCIYFFVFIGIFGFNCYGFSKFSCGDHENYYKAAIWVMLSYGVCAWFGGSCWFAQKGFCAKVKKTADMAKAKGKGQEASTLGKPEP